MIISRLVAGRSPVVRLAFLVVGLVLAFGLPWMIYPPVALDIAAWALFAVALDLLLGYTGLLSFGHAAFWGSSAYATGIIAVETGMPFYVAVLGGAVVAALIAVPIAMLSVRRTGIYFAMVTLAFAQLIYFVANQWRSVTGGENGLQGIPREAFGWDLADSFYFYYAALPLILVGLLIAWRVVYSPFGRVMVAIRENPARARALGYPVNRYKVQVFVISAFLAGIAGGVYAVGHGFASLQEVYWTTSGKVVVMNILGGMGTLWGPVLGAGIIVVLEDYLATAGIDAIGVVTGAIFVVTVLVFRRGIWGTAKHLLRSRRPSVPEADPQAEKPKSAAEPQPH
ncbi:branched-chain amino acid ABC transporter permease [Actinophytocola algeriensis]|uniref:Branched-chain amino acid transport system permease protein n=1 Tax=Actinophytocola algeriensis TaxID=1768010 RepID=A0A7W7VCX2_9PSEU|nr:branched-chain amino acid ABC transporter permease [Actinophytocola algeriensis]MBB4905566.1 branched-chain amino acid transport system permease protein [Actinophytocola algeriensis]MBE1472749.1 branched-chain amino acid transport system permease protein [Actinophytocola algeriensis]